MNGKNIGPKKVKIGFWTTVAKAEAIRKRARLEDRTLAHQASFIFKKGVTHPEDFGFLA